MIRIQRILCPQDFSDFSRRALDHAAALARWYDAEVVAVHVQPALASVEAMPVAVGPVPMPQASRESIREELEKQLLPLTRAGIRHDTEFAEGSPVEQILRTAAESACDLIVMGTHGRSGFERWVLGSVTEKVLRKATIPVMTVSQKTLPIVAEGRPPFERILCGVDFSPSSLKAVEVALSIAQEGCAELTLLHVMEGLPPFQLEAQGFDVKRYREVLEADLQEQLLKVVPEGAKDWCRPRTLVAEGKSWQKLLDVAGEQHADLIVLGVHGRNPLDVMLFGSTTHHVIRGAEAPVWTVRG